MLAFPKPTPRTKSASTRVNRRARLPRSKARIERASRPRPMRKGKLAGQKREATALLGGIVCARNGGRCQCGCGRRIDDPAHVFAKGPYPSLEWHPLNLLGLARVCHDRVGDANTGKPSLMEDLAVRVIGREDFELLRQLAPLHGKFDAGMLPSLRRQARLARLA